MREYLTGDDIFSEAQMVRDRSRGISILILEGPDDCTLFDRFIHSERCISIPAHGRDNVISAVEASVQAQFAGMLGVTDADFQRHTGVLRSRIVLLTDCHDAEIMAFESQALKSLLLEYGAPEKLKKLQPNYVQKVRNAIYKAVEPLTILRFLNESNQWRINFSEIDYDKVFDRKTLVIDTKRMTKSLLSRSKNPAVNEKDLNNVLAKSIFVDAVPQEISNGHDVCAALAIGLRSVFGTNDTKIASPENIASVLRLSFGLECFGPTSLCKNIKKWEEANRPFVILVAA